MILSGILVTNAFTWTASGLPAVPKSGRFTPTVVTWAYNKTKKDSLDLRTDTYVASQVTHPGC